MQPNLTEAEIAEFNNLFSKAIDRIKDIVILGAYSSKKPGFFAKIKIKKSIIELQRCLSLAPDHWQSMVFLAKAYQRLGQHSEALQLLQKALEIELHNHNIPQEAALECIHLNNIKQALVYSKEAIKRKPNDIVLMGNHAMNLLIAKKDKEAIDIIQNAVHLNPQDKFNLNLQKIIYDVTDGKRPRPTCENAIN